MSSTSKNTSLQPATQLLVPGSQSSSISSSQHSFSYSNALHTHGSGFSPVKTNLCRALVVWKSSEKRKRKRKAEEEMLRELWISLPYFKKMKYEPVLKDYGSVYDHGIRISERVKQKLLLTSD